ncbi:cytochrome C biogenesis protein CcsB [Pasteurellaceae bacterium Pebbles2]|nr:cytochrome C biogenesis protein CcsB [Pasteurellaceae bacterium Pebbles2]
MNKTSLFFTALFAVAFTAQANDAVDLSKGERLFKQSCATCHGKQGEKSALGQSAIIRNLKSAEIITALQARKAGEIAGAGNNVKARLSDKDMSNIAHYLESLAH